MEFFFAAALGAAGGSFLGVIIDRGVVLGRSRCHHCKHQLGWWENIPVLSYIFLRGRCRSCRSPIPYWLPLIELAGAAAGAAIAAQMSLMSPMRLMGLILIAAALIWIFFSDLVKGLVPDWAVALGAAGAVTMSLIGHMSFMSLMAQIAIAAAAGLFFWLLAAATAGRGMGPGDATLAFFLGLWLGWPLILPALWLAFLIGAIVGVGLILLGRKKFGQTIPFGPFLILGSLASLQWGQKIISFFF